MTVSGRISIFTLVWAVLFSLPSVFGGEKVLSRSESMKPRWLSHKPVPTNPSFIYVDVQGSGRTLEEAKADCFSALARNEDLKSTVEVTVDRHISKKVEQQRSNGGLTEQIRTEAQITFDVNGKRVELTANLIDLYWELVAVGGTTEYRCRSLYAVAVSPELPPLFDLVSFSRKYGARGLVRSLFVPGWGQMYKGSMAKGISILSAEVVAVGGALVAENLRASYIKKMKEQPKFAKTYNSKADNWQNVRNGFFIGSGAIYVYNLIDAIVADGAKRTIVKKNTAFRFAPVAYENGAGVSVAYQF